VALASSGIPMRDVPFAVAVGKVGEQLIMDQNYIEDSGSEADMPIAMLPRTNEIVLMQMDGSLTKEQFASAVTMIAEAGKEISRIQREALEKKYKQVSA